MVQYKAALVITAAAKETSLDRLYQDLSLKSLLAEKWFRGLFISTKLYRNFYILSSNLP